MELEELISLRNAIQSYEGKLLLAYLQDYVTNQACLKREASEIKGMCELIQQIKDVPKIVEKKRSN
jgi:hypothetical protein